MLKEFYKCLRTRINTSRKLGRQRGELVIWYQKGHDFLDIFRDAPNSYVIYFSSHDNRNSWRHEDIPLRQVVCAIKSFDGGTDMFGNPFHNEKNGTFEY
jgi:hypothetical protein